MALRRIALLTDGIFPYVIGGMQKHSFYLVKYFARKGIFVDLYHFGNEPSDDANLLADFSEAERKFIRPFLLSFPSRKRFPGHYLRSSYEYSCRVYALLIQNPEVDFVYAKGFAGWKLIEERSKGLAFAPVGVKFHGLEMFQKAIGIKAKLEQHLLLRNAVKYHVNNVDYLFSYGGRITDILKSLGAGDDRILEIPTGIEKDWLSDKSTRTEQRRSFIFIGRNEKRKGMRELKQVLEGMKKSEGFQFQFVGPIPENEKVISPNIVYHGEIRDPSKIKELLDASDILVCPSYAEGMPNVIMEGMARGLAILATDVGATNLMVDTSNGVLIPPASSDALSTAIQSFIRLPNEELIKLKEASLQKVKYHFLWENVIEETIEKINSVII